MVNKTVSEKSESNTKKYSIDSMRKNCIKLFGVSSAVFAGAVNGIENREYTVEEIKSIIKSWCRKAVK